MANRFAYWADPAGVRRRALMGSAAQRRVSGSGDVGGCVAAIRRMLETPMEDYLMGDAALLADLSGSLGLPVEAVRGMRYPAVCRRARELYPAPDALGRALWPLTKPYLAEYDRRLRQPETGDPLSPDRSDGPIEAPPESPAGYTFDAYCQALDEMYGADDARTEALFDGLFWAGCGCVIPLCKYIDILDGMTFIHREAIVCDLLVRPFLRLPAPVK